MATEEDFIRQAEQVLDKKHISPCPSDPCDECFMDMIFGGHCVNANNIRAHAREYLKRVSEDRGRCKSIW